MNNPKVLVIDDDDDIRDVLEMILSSTGYAVTSAKNGSDGLAKLAESDDVGLVLLDIMMPGMDGEEMLRALDARGAGVPVVVMTGRPGTPAVRRGVVATLPKPVELDALMRVVRSVVGTPEPPHDATPAPP